MHSLQIYLFGKFHCLYDQSPISGLEAGKAQELLSLLALNGSRPHHREVIADKLWGDTSDGKKGLRQALWQVQSALAPVGEAMGVPCLTASGDWIGLNPAAEVWVDASSLEATYRRYRSIPETQLTQEQAADLQQAAGYYCGDLLEGCYLDFCLQDRERYQFFYLSLLDKLLGYYESQQDYAGGVECAQRILRCDQARESTHRRLMQLHYRSGFRVRALHQYKTCVTILGKELGVGPSRATQEIYRLICSDELGPQWGTDDSPSSAGRAFAPGSKANGGVTAQQNDVWQAILRLQTDLNLLWAAIDHSMQIVPPQDPQQIKPSL
jgi:DNA-binding SARP family transcriptional activator